MSRRILIYIEPHPIRSQYEEFYHVAHLLSEAAIQLARSSDDKFRLFSNNRVIDRLIGAVGQSTVFAMRPKQDETRAIEQFDGVWDEDSIATWTDLVRGEGDVTNLYYSMLDRLHKSFPFEAVVIWSENGAVRRFARDREIVVLHGELGPTRPPFNETVYFDEWGTNGSASIRHTPWNVLKSQERLPPQTWVAALERGENDPEAPRLIDAPLTIVPHLFELNLPERFVYIPLQLADDINTLLCSNFESPLDFLRAVVPPILAQGYGVVVKPHPSAQSRPYNLTAETRALHYARSLGPSVVILNRKTPSFEALNIMGQSDFVVTINSSVGFEALLLGRRVLLFGDAAYDVGGVLKRSVEDLANLPAVEFDSEKIEILTSFLCSHYFHPKTSVASGVALGAALDHCFSTRDLEKTSDEYWEKWCAGLDFGLRWLQGDTPASVPLFGSHDLWRRRPQFTKQLGGLIHFVSGSAEKTDQLVRHATIQDDLFFGYIDRASLTRINDNDYNLKIQGWALECGSLAPPVLLFVIEGERVVSWHRVVAERQDVIFVVPDAITKFCGFSFEAKGITAADLNSLRIHLLSAENRVHIIEVADALRFGQHPPA